MGLNDDDVLRFLTFWEHVCRIWTSYKVVQTKSLFYKILNKPKNEIEELWRKQHSWAGNEMYALCIHLRGFYLKAGQFIGSRPDFIPEPICRKLSLLCDQVPPMSCEKTERIIREAFKLNDLNDIFEWIDLSHPVGSASISQVHKAKLRNLRPTSQSNRFFHLGRLPYFFRRTPESQPPPTAEEVTAEPRAVRELRDAQCRNLTPSNGLVAVKVQYPGALDLMRRDLSNLRAAAYLLTKTELPFDLVSPVDELRRQITLEFDFRREARIMDTISSHLRDLRHSVSIPTSIPGLVRRQVLAMSFLDGSPLTAFADPNSEASRKLRSLPPTRRTAAKRMVLTRVSEAYGRMLLGEGLFHADGHPGNILVDGRGKIGLLDFGQAKQLSEGHRRALGVLIDALAERAKEGKGEGKEEETSEGRKGKREEGKEKDTSINNTPLDPSSSTPSSPLPAWPTFKAPGTLRILPAAEAWRNDVIRQLLSQGDSVRGRIGDIISNSPRNSSLLSNIMGRNVKYERMALDHPVSEVDLKVSKALEDLGIQTSRDDVTTRAMLAKGMFDTIGRVDPFAADSPIKKVAVSSFPADLFFVLRVVQLLRGMANGLGVYDFSCARQWRPLALKAMATPLSGGVCVSDITHVHHRRCTAAIGTAEMDCTRTAHLEESDSEEET